MSDADREIRRRVREHLEGESEFAKAFDLAVEAGQPAIDGFVGAAMSGRAALIAAEQAVLRLTLPEPPSANAYWRSIVLGKAKPRVQVLVSREAQAFRREVRDVYINTTRSVRCWFPAGSLVLRIRWYRARRSGDLDNRLKQPIDALKGLAFADDSQIVEIHATRHEDPKNPRMEVELEEVR